MYRIISLISVIIRQFILPNPFSSVPNGELYNWLATVLLVPITAFIVGLFYERGTAPALGSFLFLFFYLIHTGLLVLCGVFSFNVIACIVISIVYVAILIGGVKLRNQDW